MYRSFVGECVNLDVTFHKYFVQTETGPRPKDWINRSGASLKKDSSFDGKYLVCGVQVYVFV